MNAVHPSMSRFSQHAAHLAWLLLGMVSSDAVAHHSSAPHYDLDKQIAVTGVVSKFEFVNPHAYVYFVHDDQGTQTQWRCELSAKGFLQRMGWTASTFVVGQKLTFKGSPARREDNVCVLNSFVTADGREIDTRSNLLSGQRGPAQLNVATNAAATQPAAAATPLAGYWVAQSDGPPGMGAGNGPDMGAGMGPGFAVPGNRPARPEPSEAGVQAAKSYDQRFDDPAIKCSPGNILFGWTHDQNVNEIVVGKDTVTLKYGYMDFVRTIYLNQTQHPKTLTPSLGGHSIGHFEGAQLVVDTIGFTPGVLIPIGGVLHSAQLHVVERFAVNEAGNVLTRSYQVEDPLYLKSPYSGSDIMQRSNEPYAKYQCVELSGKNNQRQ